MFPTTEDLNLIDLISETHAKLRKNVRLTWEAQGKEPVSDTESYILALLQHSPMTVSQLARIIDMSRQGIHKCTQGLLAKEYIQATTLPDNAKNKLLSLTDKGKNFCTETLVIKERFEQTLADQLGTEQILLLKEALHSLCNHSH